jgi:hypothetical protein
MVRANTDAFAAVDTPLSDNLRFSAPHAYGFGGAMLDAVGTALALVAVKPHRMEISIHDTPPLDNHSFMKWYFN